MHMTKKKAAELLVARHAAQLLDADRDPHWRVPVVLQSLRYWD
jgi:hypothetical protein